MPTKPKYKSLTGRQLTETKGIIEGLARLFRDEPMSSLLSKTVLSMEYYGLPTENTLALKTLIEEVVTSMDVCSCTEPINEGDFEE